MIKLITGVPGSGKTYLAVSFIYDNIKDGVSHIFTNIPLNNKISRINSLDIVDLKLTCLKEFELHEFYLKLKKLYHIYEKFLDKKEDSKEDKKDINYLDSSDKKFFDECGIDYLKYDFEFENPLSGKYLKTDLNEHCTNFNVYDIKDYLHDYDLYVHKSKIMSKYSGSTIYWDECHIGLESSDSSGTLKPIREFVRFFSYHRHFNIDIILITQNLSLIHRKYKSFIELYYLAKSSKKRIFSNVFRYETYSDSKMYKKDQMEKFSKMFDKKVGDLYNSGSNKISSTVFFKALVPGVVLIIVVFLLYHFFFSTQEKVDNKQVYLESAKSSNNFFPKTSSNSKINILSDRVIIFFRCNLNLCTLQNSSFVIPLKAMDKINNILDLKVLYKTSINRYYTLVAVSVSKDLYRDISRYNLERKNKDEKNQNFNHRATMPKFFQ